MKPVIPTAKRSTGFSIDSIIGTQPHSKTVCNKVPSSTSITEPSRIYTMGSMGLVGRVPPPHLGFPINFKEMFPDSGVSQELLALRSAWGLMGPQLETMHHLTQGPLQLSHNMLNGHRDPPVHLYPLLMARQNHCFGFPFPGAHESGILFHPYRKPKRIRTAFSPSQLLKLEEAFETNHYVVGQERKDLAVKLGLTETQVKVWFQNRRTKCKRVKSDDDDDNLEQLTIQSPSDKSDDENDEEGMTSPQVIQDSENLNATKDSNIVNVT